MKIILILAGLIIFNSCRKESSFNDGCGRIIAKAIKPGGDWINSGGQKGLYFLVAQDTIDVGLITWDRYQVGDQYCH